MSTKKLSNIGTFIGGGRTESGEPGLRKLDRARQRLQGGCVSWTQFPVKGKFPGTDNLFEKSSLETRKHASERGECQKALGKPSDSKEAGGKGAEEAVVRYSISQGTVHNPVRGCPNVRHNPSGAVRRVVRTCGILEFGCFGLLMAIQGMSGPIYPKADFRGSLRTNMASPSKPRTDRAPLSRLAPKRSR